jgi:hypothetical protein
MEINEFIEATSRAEQYFEKEYSNEQRQIMYEELKKMPLEKYRKTLANCIRTCKFMPKLADILKASTDIDNVNYERNRVYTPCKICGSKGFVRYYKVLQENGYEYDYACRCTCENGEYYSKSIPTFEELGIKPEERLVMNFE